MSESQMCRYHSDKPCIDGWCCCQPPPEYHEDDDDDFDYGYYDDDDEIFNGVICGVCGVRHEHDIGEGCPYGMPLV